MKPKAYIFIALALAMTISGAHGFQTKYTSGEEDYVLTEAQRTHLAESALDGSGDAALQLSRFYSHVLMDLDQGLHWALIGAENGDPKSQFTVFAYLSRRESSDDKQRAIFWLKKAAAQGYPNAVQELKHYQESGKTG